MRRAKVVYDLLVQVKGVILMVNCTLAVACETIYK